MEAVIAIVAAALALIGTRVPDLLKLKVSKDGLEADMREVIQEARATLAQLHFLASEMAKVSLENDQASGTVRWKAEDREGSNARSGPRHSP